MISSPAEPISGWPRSFSRRSDWVRTLGVMFFARFALNLPFRIVYPFLPAISRGLNMPLETTSLLLTVRSLAAMSSPLYGLLADRRGRRPVMLGGLAALVVGAMLMGVTPAFVLALAAFALLGLSKASYDPAMQAYIGDVVPYEGRGKIVGILELPWALAWLIGVPIAGFLIAWVGWHAPFWLAAGLGAISLVATWLSKIPTGGLNPGWPEVPCSRPSCPPVLPARPARGTRARVAHGPGRSLRWHGVQARPKQQSQPCKPSYQSHAASDHSSPGNLSVNDGER